MAENRMNDTPKLPATGPNSVDPTTNNPVDPPRGNAADPTQGQIAGGAQDSANLNSGTTPEPQAELHTVGADPVRHGALGKTDVNLGQDAPIDAGSEGLNIEEFREDEAA